MKLHFSKLLFLLSPLFADAQVATVCESLQPYEYDSGDTNAASTFVSYDNAPWIQLDLSQSVLAAGASLLLEGKTTSQVLNADSLSLSSNGYSAVFDGSSVRVELSSPGGGVRGVTSRVVVSNVKVGLCVDDGTDNSICGLEDDRIPSTDVRVGRIGGCTGWLISEDVFVQAGHCGTPSSSTRIHFVYGTGNAAPEDQYAVDVSTYNFEDQGIGRDWGAARLLANSVTGKLPGVAQSEKCGSPGCGWFNLGTVPSSGNIRITGYGTAAVDSRSQKTHFDALVSVASTYLQYVPDTTGGNSGSPVIHEETGDAVGVHTHGGCSSTSGSNHGTRIDVTNFAAHIDFLINTGTPSPTFPPTTAAPTTAPPTISPTITATPTYQPTPQPTSLCGDILDKSICQGTNGRCEWINGKNSGCFDPSSSPPPPSPTQPGPTPPSPPCTCSTVTDNKACNDCGNCSWSGKDKICADL